MILIFLGGLYSPAFLGLSFLVLFSLASNLLVFGVAVSQSRFHSGASRFFGLGVMLAVVCIHFSCHGPNFPSGQSDNYLAKEIPSAVGAARALRNLPLPHFHSETFRRCSATGPFPALASSSGGGYKASGFRLWLLSSDAFR